MTVKGLVLFDIDGVIRDVENSYRLALKGTVKKFCGWIPNNHDIDSLKSEGSWNNDWDASLELIKRHINKNNLSLGLPIRETLIKEFNNFYFGGNPYGDPKEWKGFIKDESLLVEKSFFDELSKQNIGWGFVSGAERPSAEFVLEKRLKLKNFPLLTMNEAPDKPDPTGLIRLASDIFSQPLGGNNPPITYLGDTVADVLTIQNAREKIPTQKFVSFAVAPPHLHKKENQVAREFYENELKEAGADKILNSTTAILDHL